jgi:hypothetical protein
MELGVRVFGHLRIVSFLPILDQYTNAQRWGVTRSLFNYLVPMLQEKRAEEEETEEGGTGLVYIG